MTHSYLRLSDSTNYPGKLLVGQSATSGATGCGLTNTNVKVIEIPSTFNGKEVVEIGFLSFYNTGITSVFIPNTVLCIYYAAFGECYSLTEVRFQEGSRLWKFDKWIFWRSAALKKIDIPASVTTIIYDSSWKFFEDVTLDCFSYAGTTNFASLSYFFNTVTTVYVSNSYPSSTFAGKTVTKGTKTCGVSSQYFIDPTRTLTPTSTLTPTRTRVAKCSVIVRLNGPFQQFMFLLIQS
jgi:hypothetical protein